MRTRISFAAALAVALAVAALMMACASHGGLALKKSMLASPEERLDAIHRAQVWAPTDITSMDLKTGPQGHGAFKPNESVTCKYVDKEMGGKSPKFTCVIPPDDEVKVKFGQENGEVYAEVAATRLFWALGFPTDHMYPVRVVCEGCPAGAEAIREKGGQAIVFDSAAIERKLKGWVIETAPESGWAWPELDKVDETVGGASRAQRDALKLLAVLVQHTDSKPEQQRLLCLDEKAGDGHAKCAHAVMMVNDLGQTFGRSNVFNRSAVGSVNLEQWSAAHVWGDASHCIGDLPPSQTGTLDHPVIGEAGRKFLADLLMQLSDAQLHDLFEVSRFAERKGGARRAASVDEWVDAFKKKRGEIASRTCPS